MNEIKKSSLFRAGDSQVIKVPHGFELPGTEITVTREGHRLIIEPTLKANPPKSWAEVLDQMETIDVDWPDVDEGLLPLDDVEL
ncbi:antitoxin [Devosia honganensis]|uniref:Antitoxin n=1 Tax=Devosia honganensis TaxID=1610527 RepID=A0ABV7X3P4_9HYPH